MTGSEFLPLMHALYTLVLVRGCTPTRSLCSSSASRSNETDSFSTHFERWLGLAMCAQ